MKTSFVYKMYQALYQSKYARYIISFFYRIYFFREYRSVSEFVQKNDQKKIVALNAYTIYQFNHIKPLYQALVKDPSYTVILIGSNPKKIHLPEYQAFMQENNFRVNKNVFSYIWLHTLKPDIFLDTANTQYPQLCHDKTVKVLFAHSLASLGFSKNHSHIKDTVAYDYILSTGPYQKKTLEQAAKEYKVRLPEIIPGGFIRGDMLAEKSKNFDRHGFISKCGLTDKMTILFAPTWGKFSTAAEWIDPIVALSEELDFNLLIQLHPIMLTGKTKWETAGIEWDKKLQQLNKNRNIHICGMFDLENYMLCSDVIITGASSIGMEFMFLRKPVIFLPAPDFFSVFGRNKPIFWVRKGLEVRDIVELKEKIRTINSDSKFTLDYDIHNIAYNPGNAIESISTFIKDICEAHRLSR